MEPITATTSTRDGRTHQGDRDYRRPADGAYSGLDLAAIDARVADLSECSSISQAISRVTGRPLFAIQQQR